MTYEERLKELGLFSLKKSGLSSMQQSSNMKKVTEKKGADFSVSTVERHDGTQGVRGGSRTAHTVCLNDTEMVDSTCWEVGVG